MCLFDFHLRHAKQHVSSSKQVSTMYSAGQICKICFDLADGQLMDITTV